jgi:hypothetical protein
MPAAQYDITIEQGATWTLSLVWKDSGGNPITLTGYTARMQARSAYAAADTMLDLTSGSGITLGPAAGAVALVASAAQTSAITAKKGVYDLEMVAPDGAVTRLLQGAVTVSPEVTR